MTLRTLVHLELAARASWRVARPVLRVGVEAGCLAFLAGHTVYTKCRRLWDRAFELPMG